MTTAEILYFVAAQSSAGPLPPPVPIYTDAQLRHIRSALFTVRAPVSMGPRPGQPDNCFSWGEWIQGHYTPDEAEMGFDAWKVRKYTHAAIGPFVDKGYHGQFPPTTLDVFLAKQDEWLARILTLHAHGIIPVAFLGVDNWSLDQMRQFEPVFRKPSWQAALPMVVPHGWEPSRDTPNAEWVEWVKWGADVFPHALRAIHMNTDSDTCGNNDDLTLYLDQIPGNPPWPGSPDDPARPKNPAWIGPAECWHRVAPYLHLFLAQYGPFYTRPQDDPNQVIEWQKVWREQRFVNGIAGWPTFSAAGPNVPIQHVAAEFCDYPAWWNNLPEAVCQEWGDLALDAGAFGCFGACTRV